MNVKFDDVDSDMIIVTDKNKKEFDLVSNYSELVCMVCRSGLDEDKLLICDKCNLAIHAYCNEPEILEAAALLEQFICFKCVDLV